MSKYQIQKQAIVEAAQDLTKKGFLMATGGNLSMRIIGEKVFAVTPSDFDYMKMTAEDICILDFELNRLEGDLKPSVEAAMHSAIYQVRPDVTAVVHTHQVYASALTLMNKPIPGLFDEQTRFLGRSVDIIPYAPSGTGMLKDTITKNVKNHNNAYLMKNHGALLFGINLERACHNVEILEKCSLAYLITLCAEKKASKVPLVVREIAFAKLRNDQKRVEKGENALGGE
ncbi:MAG: aldolase [Chloroflexi bacterium HGW-Chloroflexi-4]|jgi:L-ribulose-5-phosphate 4-epimerase|nr:MAG: aldolase [Chloroflexi bacterium HGW-Chloroflexi-4]